jgi:hypothetical protein
MANNDPFQEGYNAHWCQADITDNPYEEESGDFRLWEDGWYKARQDEDQRSLGEH